MSAAVPQLPTMQKLLPTAVASPSPRVKLKSPIRVPSLLFELEVRFLSLAVFLAFCRLRDTFTNTAIFRSCTATSLIYRNLRSIVAIAGTLGVLRSAGWSVEVLGTPTGRHSVR